MQTPPQKERQEVSRSALAPQRHWDTRQTQRTKRIKGSRAESKLFSQGHPGKTHTHTHCFCVCVQQRKWTWKLVFPLRVQCGGLAAESHNKQCWWRSRGEQAVHLYQLNITNPGKQKTQTKRSVWRTKNKTAVIYCGCGSSNISYAQRKYFIKSPNLQHKSSSTLPVMNIYVGFNTHKSSN